MERWRDGEREREKGGDRTVLELALTGFRLELAPSHTKKILPTIKLSQKRRSHSRRPTVVFNPGFAEP